MCYLIRVVVILQVNHLVQRHLAVLSVEKFCVLYSKFNILPDEVYTYMPIYLYVWVQLSESR